MITEERFHQLAEAVHMMRDAQRRYFNVHTRDRESLENAKKCEQIVDRMIEEYRKRNPQQQLFEQ
ncbi:hypothetical protein [Chitinophaga lutea]|uniref:hypothetical protein n=1 Tax=Chitinophaga lutea TaxID=2488634 RepID=UPI000F510714|nr:hypothetical protein [Chitinophaga lutea]